MWQRDEWLETAQVEVHLLIVLCIFVRKEFSILLTTLLCLHKRLHDFIRRKDRGGGTHLRTHVRDGETLRYRQRLYTIADVLEDLSETALDGDTAKHLEDDFLCVHTGLQPAREVHLDNLRHRKTHRNACHRGRDVHATDTDRQHADGTTRWGMAVTTHQKLTLDRETGGLYHVADTVSRSRYIYAGLLCDGPKIVMIVRRLEIDIQQIMIQIRYRGLHLRRNAQLLEAEIGHDRIDIVRERLIDLDKHILTCCHRPLHHVGTDDLSR